MRDLPNDWYEQSMRPLREEAEHWPEWMQRGVDDARHHAERRMAKYLPATAAQNENEP
jgi:hypothetical protein